MARPKKLTPDYCHHKPSCRAFVTLNGSRKYLGDHGTQVSRDEYDRVVGKWIAAGRQLVEEKSADDSCVTVSGVIAVKGDGGRLRP